MFAQKINKNAKIPSRAHETDTGYDLWAIRKIKTQDNLVYLGTGLKIAPVDKDVYMEIHARSSCPKHGWTLANNVGIIDTDYRGELILCMHKLHDNAEIPKLPWKCAQLIPRKKVPLTITETPSLDVTCRGNGGFGSTD